MVIQKALGPPRLFCMLQEPLGLRPRQKARHGQRRWEAGFPAYVTAEAERFVVREREERFCEYTRRAPREPGKNPKGVRLEFGGRYGVTLDPIGDDRSRGQHS